MQKTKSRFARYSGQDKAMLITGYILLGLFVVAIIVPMIYIIVASMMDPITLQNRGITFDFSKWTLTAYQRVLENKQIWTGFRNAVVYSVVFTALSLLVTLLAAYPMSRADFKGRGFYNVLFVITMFFSGGLIPIFLNIRDLGLYDTRAVMILMNLVSVWNLMVARTYIQTTIPNDLYEAAVMDGAGHFTYFFRCVVPLSGTIVAVLAVYLPWGL